MAPGRTVAQRWWPRSCVRHGDGRTWSGCWWWTRESMTPTPQGRHRTTCIYSQGVSIWRCTTGMAIHPGSPGTHPANGCSVPWAVRITSAHGGSTYFTSMTWCGATTSVTYAPTTPSGNQIPGGTPDPAVRGTSIWYHSTTSSPRTCPTIRG